jgi:uncharacterized protein DUF829
MSLSSGAHVAILGWAGARARQLRGVARFYGTKGARPLSATPHVFRAMASPWGWTSEGQKLASRLLALEPAPVIVHAFSNAGFWTYAAALRALEQSREGRALRDRIACVVFDSAPGFPERLDGDFTARYSAMAMMPALLSALRRPPALSHPRLDIPLRTFMRVWYHLSPWQIRRAEESLTIVRSVGDWPFLFLYSRADPLVRYEDVEAFVASVRRTSSRPVRAVRWDDSEHVGHLIRHRAEYFTAISALLGAPDEPLVENESRGE